MIRLFWAVGFYTKVKGIIRGADSSDELVNCNTVASLPLPIKETILPICPARLGKLLVHLT